MRDIDTPGRKEIIGSVALRRTESGTSAWHVAEETVFFPRECEAFDDLARIADEHLFNHYAPLAPVFAADAKLITIDPARHACEISSVEENAENLRRIVSLVREHLGDLPIVFTLSPVPLNATMRGTSPLVADCVSKSTLRVAIDQVLREEPAGVYYWPAFEMVRWVGAHSAQPTFGGDGSPRHPMNRVVRVVVDRFVRAFFGLQTEEPPAAPGPVEQGLTPFRIRARLKELAVRFVGRG